MNPAQKRYPVSETQTQHDNNFSSVTEGFARQRQGEAGFTLLELLVAMALAAVVGMAVYSLSSSVMDAYDQVRKVRQRDFGFTMVSEVVREDLGALYCGSAVQPDLAFIGKQTGGIDEAFMRFTTASTLDLTEPERLESLYLVRYSLEEAEDNEQAGSYVFVREERKWAGVNGGFTWSKVVVARDIVNFSVQYAAVDSRDWSAEWKGRDSSPLARVPYGVKMTFTFAQAPDVTKELLILVPAMEQRLVKG